MTARTKRESIEEHSEIKSQIATTAIGIFFASLFLVLVTSENEHHWQAHLLPSAVSKIWGDGSGTNGAILSLTGISISLFIAIMLNNLKSTELSAVRKVILNDTVATTSLMTAAMCASFGTASYFTRGVNFQNLGIAALCTTVNISICTIGNHKRFTEVRRELHESHKRKLDQQIKERESARIGFRRLSHIIAIVVNSILPALMLCRWPFRLHFMSGMILAITTAGLIAWLTWRFKGIQHPVGNADKSLRIAVGIIIPLFYTASPFILPRDTEDVAILLGASGICIFLLVGFSAIERHLHLFDYPQLRHAEQTNARHEEAIRALKMEAGTRRAKPRTTHRQWRSPRLRQRRRRIKSH